MSEKWELSHSDLAKLKRKLVSLTMCWIQNLTNQPY